MMRRINKRQFLTPRESPIIREIIAQRSSSAHLAKKKETNDLQNVL
jgi:hypothetical protein